MRTRPATPASPPGAPAPRRRRRSSQGASSRRTAPGRRWRRRSRFRALPPPAGRRRPRRAPFPPRASSRRCRRRCGCGGTASRRPRTASARRRAPGRGIETEGGEAKGGSSSGGLRGGAPEQAKRTAARMAERKGSAARAAPPGPAGILFGGLLPRRLLHSLRRFHERRQEVDRHGEDGRRVVLGGHLPQGLQVTELYGDGGLADDPRRIGQLLGGLELALGPMTFARRSRSASACLAMALCISWGRSMFLISTFETFTPQGSVSLSRISWMWALILSAWTGDRPARPARRRSAASSAKAGRWRTGSSQR